ncbi:serine protease Do [Singulisphaera sp. GP187]|uniref:S1C family serine protease n=1 Tax=Singulisphaera sp. GP187 TaxID=1882752 RepID=UPI000926049F|nr:trypsin-like peptidase domain-containing protein [Singulisphaera sp. GP187]SIO33030.1 serine protease Do [Singulisphaera sp. GP187]
MLRYPWIILLCVLPTLLSSCGPPVPASSPPTSTVAVSATNPNGNEPEGTTLLEAIERTVAESIAKLRDSAVALEYAVADAPSGARRVATGVVVNDRGDVLSIRIDPPKSTAPILARDASGGRHPARWVAADAETGLTLLRIDPSIAKPVRPASRAPRLGSQVLIIGNPFGLGHSVIRGQVAGLDRRVDVGPRPLGGLIQLDASLHPGDSGALVANLRGEWLGLIRSGLARPGGEGEGRTFDHDLGFAIPAHDALWIAEQLGLRRRVDRAYLGVRLNLDPVDTPSGAILDGIVSDSPAARAGLKTGDRVLAFDGFAIKSPSDLTDRLDRTLANSETTLEYLRGSRRDRLTIRTSSRPPLIPDPPRSSAKEDDLPSPRPRELNERIELLERRLRDLEKQEGHSEAHP